MILKGALELCANITLCMKLKMKRVVIPGAYGKHSLMSLGPRCFQSIDVSFMLSVYVRNIDFSVGREMR